MQTLCTEMSGSSYILMHVLYKGLVRQNPKKNHRKELATNAGDTDLRQNKCAAICPFGVFPQVLWSFLAQFGANPCHEASIGIVAASLF